MNRTQDKVFIINVKDAYSDEREKVILVESQPEKRYLK